MIYRFSIFKIRGKIIYQKITIKSHLEKFQLKQVNKIKFIIIFYIDINTSKNNDDLNKKIKKYDENQINNISIVNDKELLKDEEIEKQIKKENENADNEYLLCLKKALNDAIGENDNVLYIINIIQLIIIIKKLEKENKELKEIIEEKNNAIIELANYYDVNYIINSFLVLSKKSFK